MSPVTFNTALASKGGVMVWPSQSPTEVVSFSTKYSAFVYNGWAVSSLFASSG
eukprot:CAMPEP_0184984552 /NCGR_PEP_ID=MMETSP1098-20130426/13504_1 /TAXON_ID=89044 /ORGANISM="Spumella elongata, Strain CCAP 955/1" /LENGTH=52 /DNA_ID=CAMNT_0027508555 /DNA_START=19 /DNA_END=177 /DNA_ORIENTATION=-